MRRNGLFFAVATLAGFVILGVLGRAALFALGAVTGFSPAAGLAAAIVAVRWEKRRVTAPVFGGLAALIALASGVGIHNSTSFGLAMAVEVMVAAWFLRRTTHPLDRPETSAWWARWGLAAGIGVVAGAAVFVVTDWPSSGVMSLAANWVIGHGSGLMLVAPGVWAGMRWSHTGGWRHREDLRQMVIALGGVTLSVAAAAGLALWLERADPFVIPFLVLAWLAQRAGHRVTLMASSLVATVILLAEPLWIDVALGASSVSAAVRIVLGHAAASALAIEASARWHARALLSGVVDIATESVLIVDGAGRVMTGNPAARLLFGSLLEGAAIRDLIPGLPVHWADAPANSLVVDGRNAQGRLISVEVAVGPVDVPGRPMFAVVCRDMTEIRAAAAALRRSAEIIDASPDLVGWTDAVGNLLFLNRAGREMMGAGEDEAIDAWSAAGLLTRDAIEEASAHGTWRGETNLVDRHGAALPLLQTVVAHRSDEGAVRFYSVLARDNSERHALEQMKHEFVSNVTHELRSPLTGVIGYLELLTSGSFGELPIQVAEVLHDVDASAHRLLELINDLLALWRAEDRATEEPEDLDLVEVVAAAIKTMEPVAASKRIALTLVGDSVHTAGDRRQLERAFLNVISNAIKFTPNRGRVSVTVEVRDGEAVVEITDSGVGIPAAELDAVFDRFYRASTAVNADIPGTGLGLPLVREVVRAHGGDVRVDSVLGVGTTFTIELPVLYHAHSLVLSAQQTRG